jgi:outer membrane lipoprotein-sorting protein
MRISSTVAALALGIGAQRGSASPTPAVEDLLARSRAAYAALQSYADAGTMTYEFPGVTDRYRFRTYFRRQSHDLFFDWQGVSSYTAAVHFTNDLTGRRTVIWMKQGDMQRYDAQARTVDRYPPGSNQTSVLTLATSVTHGVSTLIPSMLYDKAELVSTLRELQQVRDAGLEDVDGHSCHRLVGTASEQYGRTGHVVNVRQATVWIDAKSLLIRKVVEETPHDAGSSSYRLTISLQPEANPSLDDSRFQFSVPSR